jgi:serine/threonine protein kinase
MELIKQFNERSQLVHVDIKPSNICTSACGRELYLIDFGYSCSPTCRLPGQTGTPLFMSETIQRYGATFPSYTDDFESIGYMLMVSFG